MLPMKKWCLAGLLLSSLLPVHSADQDYKLVTVAGYLNFYLLNLNACQDFHPSVRKDAYAAESTLYPWLDKLDAKTKGSIDSGMLNSVVQKRRDALNAQIKDGDFTIDHCHAVIKLLTADGLDKTLLKAIE
jgi:hypothetical protein